MDVPNETLTEAEPSVSDARGLSQSSPVSSTHKSTGLGIARTAKDAGTAFARNL
jgi:hypothetical protein